MQILPALFKGLKEFTDLEDRIGYLESWPPDGVSGDHYSICTRYFLTFEEARKKALEVIDTYEDEVRRKLLEKRAATLALEDTCRWPEPPEEIL